MVNKSDRWVQSLCSLTSKLEIEGNRRNRLAGALHVVSNQHHRAIVRLIRQRCPGSAFALLRPQFEAYVRAIWALGCASDDDVVGYLKGTVGLGIDKYIKPIENLGRYKSGKFTELKDRVWEVGCDFTHGGTLQASWHIGTGSIGPAFTSKQIKFLLAYSNGISLDNSVSLASLCGNGRISEKICLSYSRIFKADSYSL